MAEHDVSKFLQHTDATLFKACEHLRHGKHCRHHVYLLFISIGFGSCLFTCPSPERIQHGHLGKVKFRDLEQSLGLSYATQGILFDLTLRDCVRPISCLQYDWMHCLVVQGTFQLEMNLAISVLSHRGFNLPAMKAWMPLSYNYIFFLWTLIFE